MPRKSTKIAEQLQFSMTPPTECALGESAPYRRHIFQQDTFFLPSYVRKNGLLFTDDSLEWLKTIQDNTIDLIFADPPYNIRKADWDKFESQEAYIQWSMQWIAQAARILKPSGSLYICGFSETLADLKHPAMKYFSGCKWLIWHYRNKANLGKDWGRSHESIIHLRKTKQFGLNIDAVRVPYGEHTLKYPVHPQADSSLYSNGKKASSVWVPSQKMSSRYPPPATAWVKRPSIQPKSRRSCCGSWSWPPAVWATSYLIPSPVPGPQRWWRSNSSAYGWAAT